MNFAQFKQTNRALAAAALLLISTPALAGGFADKWIDARGRVAVQQRVVRQCEMVPATCTPAAERFLELVAAARAAPIPPLAYVNMTVNAMVRPVSDLDQYGVADLWATPLMTMSSLAGDCEDYAILKYYVLRELGYPEHDMRLIVVLLPDRVWHAVLAVHNGVDWVVLDNLRPMMLTVTDYPATTIVSLDTALARN